METGITRCCLDKQVSWWSWNSRTLHPTDIHKLPFSINARNHLSSGPQPVHSCVAQTGKYRPNQVFTRAYSLPANLEESSSLQSDHYTTGDGIGFEDVQMELQAKPLSSNELKSLLADSERAVLVRKLSEANRQNRFIKRELQLRDELIESFKSDLAATEFEFQSLLKLADEISKMEIPKGTRKINGKYIQCHLLSRLEVVRAKLKEHIKDVVALYSPRRFTSSGMEWQSVQVMGTFDAWSQGEHLSPEYDGSLTTFTTTLMLRPGRYEIKFLVDGEWQLSPELPTVGDGITQNNLLIVD